MNFEGGVLGKEDQRGFGCRSAGYLGATNWKHLFTVYSPGPVEINLLNILI